MKSKKIIAVLSLSFALTNFVGCTPKTDIGYDDDLKQFWNSIKFRACGY